MPGGLTSPHGAGRTFVYSLRSNPTPLQIDGDERCLSAPTLR
jgi:hypothetical protein